MPLSFMNPVKAEYATQSVKPGMGENQYGTPFSIDESESVSSRNLTSRAFPAMSVRPGRAKFLSALTVPNALGARDNSIIHVIDGTVWKYWSGTEWVVVREGLVSARGSFIDFTTGTTKFTIMSNGTQAGSFVPDVSFTEISAFPKTKMMTAHRGRIYALFGRELKFCALNLITDWSTINDAGTIVITNAKSDGTAILEYADHVVVFTANSMHELHGTGPFNYQLIDISEDGCTAGRTLIESNGVLYFLDGQEFKAYAGGKPVVISQKIQGYLKAIPDAYKNRACCGKLGKYLYLSIPYGETTENNLLLEFDTELKQWYPQTGSFIEFITVGDILYGLDANGQIWNMASGTKDGETAIAWYKESGAYSKGSIRKKKNLQRVYVAFDQPAGSTLTMATSAKVDAEDFVVRKKFEASTIEQSQRAIMDANILGYVDWFRLKLAGTGPVTVHAIEQVYRMER